MSFAPFSLFTNKLNHFFAVYCFTAHLFKCMLAPTNVGIQWLSSYFQSEFLELEECKRAPAKKVKRNEIAKAKNTKKKKEEWDSKKKLSAVGEWQWHRLHMLNGMLAFFTCTFKQFQMFWHYFSCFDEFLFRFPNFTLAIYVIQLTIRSWPLGLAPSLRFNAVFVHVMHLYV